MYTPTACATGAAAAAVSAAAITQPSSARRVSRRRRLHAAPATRPSSSTFSQRVTSSQSARARLPLSRRIVVGQCREAGRYTLYPSVHVDFGWGNTQLSLGGTSDAKLSVRWAC